MLNRVRVRETGQGENKESKVERKEQRQEARKAWTLVDAPVTVIT